MGRFRVGIGTLAFFVAILGAPSCGGRAPESPAQKPAGGTLLVDKLPEGVEGLELRDGAVHLLPGYTLAQTPSQQQASGTIHMILDPHGGSTKTGTGCGCKSTSGTCTVESKGGIAVCSSDGCERCGLAVWVGGVATEVATF